MTKEKRRGMVCIFDVVYREKVATANLIKGLCIMTGLVRYLMNGKNLRSDSSICLLIIS